MIPNELKIVAPDLIPKGLDCSFDNLSELYKLGLLMQDICNKEKGIGLSAVQVGIPLNFFIVQYEYFSTVQNYKFFVNCNYTPITDDKEKSVEGCLSLKHPDGKLRYFEVERFKNVLIKGKELVSEPKLEVKDFELEPKDYFGIVFQHEIDHQFQITIDQIGKEVFLWGK